MFVRFAVICWLLLSAAYLQAAAQLKMDSLLVGSKVYSNVTVYGANATDLYFRHAHGLANVKLKYLNPDLQKRFDYDPERASVAEQQRARDEVLFQAAIGAKLQAQAEAVAAAARKAAATSESSLADSISDTSPLGKPAPELKIEKWVGEKPETTNKFVVIYFWTPWSIPCRSAIPQLNALHTKFGARLSLIALTSETQVDIDVMPGPKIEFASALDPKAELTEKAGVATIPFVWLQDPKGILRYQGHPAALTEKAVEKILATVPPPE